MECGAFPPLFSFFLFFLSAARVEILRVIESGGEKALHSEAARKPASSKAENGGGKAPRSKKETKAAEKRRAPKKETKAAEKRRTPKKKQKRRKSAALQKRWRATWMSCGSA
ncbi:MAG TPA: hypothetical protein VMG10_03565 [Gemmataceae bacterium]|nr:hypothetical protein [Gemmataceae bacterium]